MVTNLLFLCSSFVLLVALESSDKQILRCQKRVMFFFLPMLDALSDIIMFLGHDTTASGISWTLYDLACHPDIQRRCQQEVDALLEGRDSDEILW